MVVRGGGESSPSPSIDRQHFFSSPTKAITTDRKQAFRSGRRRYGTPKRRPSPSQLEYDHEEDLNDKRDDRRDDAPSHMEGEHVCDYDTSATVLYELLESSSWERARARCRSHPEEVRTWIVRKDKTLAVRWKLLPLHAAIIFQSPNYLVSAIMEQYPAATHRTDDQDMLPLHLAFRHKHEDEDLLELLLVKFPKAVLLKDRRERVPLEHAREAKFSAKLMRLYADSVTAASRLVGKGHPLTPTTLYSSETMTAGERALLLKDHKDELAALKQRYELQIRKLKSSSADQVRSVESDAEKRVDMIRSDYETQIRKLKDHHERNVEKLKESSERHIRKVEQGAEEKHTVAANRHAEELKKLRQRLNEQQETDKELTDSLEKDIAHLQVALQECRLETETTAGENSRLNAENETFRDTLIMVKKQHKEFHELLTQQIEDYNTARSVRKELIQTLTRLDEEKKYQPAMGDIIERLQRKIDQSMERGTTNLRPTKAAALPVDHQYKPSEQYKRAESPQHAQRYPRLEPSPEREATAARPHTNRLERARHHRIEDRRSKLSRNRQERISEDDFDDTDGDYGEVRVLADEISAITDNSGF